MTPCDVCGRAVRSVAYRFDPWHRKTRYICGTCLAEARLKTNLKRAVKDARKKVR